MASCDSALDENYDPLRTIHEAALVVRFGLETRDLLDTVHVYPTMSEAVKMVAQTYDRDVPTLSCCAA